MFKRNTPSRERFDGEPVSCSSVVTIVAKLGQCLSLSEKNVAPMAWAMTVSGYVLVIQSVISSGFGPGPFSDGMPRA